MLTFKKGIKVKTIIMAKRDFQSLLTQFRNEKGYIVEKLDAGYQVYFVNKEKEKQAVVVAMNGNNGYLIRHDVECLSPA